MNLLKSLFILLLLGLSFSIKPVQALETNSIKDLFNKANQFYHQQKYTQAIATYKEIESLELVNGDLYYNMGNSYLKNGNLGLAKLYYLKAQRYIPRDHDLLSNLNFVNNKVGEKTELSFFDKLIAINNKISLQEVITLFLIFWIISWILIILMFLLNNKKEDKSFNSFFEILNHNKILLQRVLSTFIISSFIISLSNLIYFYDLREKKAVIISQEAEIKTASDINSISLFKLNEGDVIKIISKADLWSKVQYGDSLGWIQNNSIQQVF